jgi:DNA-binding MarR family transcriptional regulator
MKKKVSKADYEALASFRYALRQFFRFSENAVQDLGLTPQQHQAMLVIRGYPGRDRVLIGEMAERLQIRHHSAVGLVDRLELQGLVVRTPASEDRRQVYISLTPGGEALLEQLSAVHREELRQLAPQLREALERVASQDGVKKRTKG